MSGSPYMTVINDDNADGLVTCRWFEKYEQKIELCEDEFDRAALTLVSDEDAKSARSRWF